MTRPTYESFHQELRRFVAERDWDAFHSPKDLALSVTIEAAELLEIFQWRALQAADLTPEDRRRIGEELADVVTYCQLLADKAGLDLPGVLLEKLARNQEKYPIEKARGRADKYDRL